MKTVLLILTLSAAAFSQQRLPPTISTGPDSPVAALCSQLTTGNVYVRSEDSSNGPIQVLRCTQVGSNTFAYLPIDHFVGDTLPTKCAVGDVAFKTGVSAGQNIYGCSSTDTWTRQAAGTGIVSYQTGLGDGLNAIPAATYLQSGGRNEFGSTWTLTSIKCYTDNNGTSTMTVTNSAGTALLSGAITCTNSYAAGTQSATVAIAAGDYLKFTFIADGTSKQTAWVVTGTR